MTKEEQMYREERQLKAIVKCNLMTTDCVTTGTVARRLKMKASELYRKLKERQILKTRAYPLPLPKGKGATRAQEEIISRRLRGSRR